MTELPFLLSHDLRLRAARRLSTALLLTAGALLAATPAAAAQKAAAAPVKKTAPAKPAAPVATPVAAPAMAAPAAPSVPISDPGAAARRGGDYIVAVVNQELVTNSEVQARVQRVEQDAARSGTTLPDRDTLQRDLLDQLIDERAQLGLARETGIRVDDSEIDRAVTSVAAQNQLTVAQLRDRLRTEGMDYARFRTNLRDQILLERLREREVQGRIRPTDADIETWLAQQREKNGAATEYNIAQILITVPENASPAVVAQRRQAGVAALQRLRAGEDFNALVRELSDGSKDRGGEIGLRRADKLPDLFVEAVVPLRAGEVAPQVLRSGAGFHVIKLIERRDAALTVQQQHARHILLRLGPKLSQDAAIRRLAGYKRQIESGAARFEDLARQYSEDGSAAQGGDLGWASPGQFVPEFEQVLTALRPGSLSEPTVSRFGVHLMQLLERREVRLDTREQREMARNALREQRYDETYADWAREVRARSYVELRDPPGQ